MIIIEIKRQDRTTILSGLQIDIEKETNKYTIETHRGIERGYALEYSKQVRDGYFMVKITEKQ